MGEVVADVKALSLDERASLVRRAFEALMVAEQGAKPGEPMGLDCYPVDIYDDYAVVMNHRDGGYYRVDYTMNADGVTLQPRAEWQPVEKEWVDRKAAETMVMFGDAVKALSDNRVGGYLIMWGDAQNRDLTGEFFTKATDLGLEWYDRRPLLYHHGVMNPLKATVIGVIDKMTVDDTGVFVEAQLDLRNRYVKGVKKLVEKGALGWSSGTMAHLREVKAGGEITRWPIVEGSLTAAAIDPRPIAIPLKSLPISNLELPDDEPEPTAEGEQSPAAGAEPTVDAGAVVDTAEAETQPVIQIVTSSEPKEGDNMGEAQPNEVPPVENERITTLETSVKSVSDKLDTFLAKLEALPQSQNPGYFTVDGGKADQNVKSFGDFLLSVKRGDTTRLASVYGVKALGDNALSTDQGATGGFLIPEEYSAQLLSVVNQTSGIVPLVRTINVSAPAGKYPSLDQFFAPTAGVGNTAFAGGVNTAVTAEGGTFTETEPGFEMIEWNINKIGGVIYVTTEMMQDSPISIESLLTQYVGVAIANKEEYYIFRGNGVGQPLGILNSDAAILTGPDTNATFAYADAAEILSRFKSVGGSPTWVAHPSTIPDLMRFEVGTGGAVWVANVQGQVPMSLLGYPVRFSEHLPQADNAGHVGLYDLSAYLLFRRSGISIAYSEHAAFTSGKVAWRFEERLDGKPALKDDITLADPQGSYTVSPFSVFQD